MTLQIWQIYFKPEQRSALDNAFAAFDNSGVAAETLEFNVFQRLFLGEAAGFDRWGALSWRFHEKTGLSGDQLIQRVQADPAVDVFYMNPSPKDEALYESPWVQGEISHPGLLEIAKAVLQILGYPLNAVYRLTHSTEYSLCNYFVGSTQFWQAYVPFVERILDQAERELPESLRVKLHSSDADWRGLHHQSSYVPFLVERLFSVFMQEEGRHLRGQQVKLPTRETKLSPALLELREMKDVAIRTQSSRILERWRKERDAYVLAHHTPAWCERFLPVLRGLPGVF